MYSVLNGGVTDHGNPGLLSVAQGPLPEDAPLYWCLSHLLPRFLSAASACAGALGGCGGRMVPLITATPSMRGGGARTDSNIYLYLQFGTSLGFAYRVQRIEILESSCEVPSTLGLLKSRAIISRTQTLFCVSCQIDQLVSAYALLLSRINGR
ncbi:hypothetical protein BDW72DRAFT_71225 [Aspergillus terricola var. indicus]